MTVFIVESHGREAICVYFPCSAHSLKEEAFWSNYFYRISLLRERFGLEPLPLVPQAKSVDTDDLPLEIVVEVEQPKDER